MHLLAQSPLCSTNRAAILQAKTEQLRLEEGTALEVVTARLDSLTRLLQDTAALAPAPILEAAACQPSVPSITCFPEAFAVLQALGATQQAPMIGYLTQIAHAAARQASDLLTYTEECAADWSREGAARPRLEDSHAGIPDVALPREGSCGDASNTTSAGSSAAVARLAVPEDQDVIIRETPAHLELRAVRCAQCALLCCTLRSCVLPDLLCRYKSKSACV